MSAFQKMEVIPVNDLDVALHNFVNKDDKLAFYSCVKYNLEETRVSISYYLLCRSKNFVEDLALILGSLHIYIMNSGCFFVFIIFVC